MNHDMFLAQVQRRTGLTSHEAAERVARATLGALGHCLADAGELAHNVAEQLPGDLGQHLKGGAEEPFARTGLAGFFEEVGQREGGDGTSDVAEHARAVIAVLCQALPEGTTWKIRHALPPDLAPLFGVGNDRGPMRA